MSAGEAQQLPARPADPILPWAGVSVGDQRPLAATALAELVMDLETVPPHQPDYIGEARVLEAIPLRKLGN